MSGALDPIAPLSRLGIQQGNIRYSQFVRYRMNLFLKACTEWRGGDPSEALQLPEDGICGVAADAYLVSRLKNLRDFDLCWNAFGDLILRNLINEETLHSYLEKIGVFDRDPVVPVRVFLEQAVLNYLGRKHNALLQETTAFLSSLELPIACPGTDYIFNLNIFARMLVKLIGVLPSDSYCTFTAGWHRQILIAREITQADGKTEKIYELFDSNLYLNDPRDLGSGYTVADVQVNSAELAGRFLATGFFRKDFNQVGELTYDFNLPGVYSVRIDFWSSLAFSPGQKEARRRWVEKESFAEFLTCLTLDEIKSYLHLDPAFFGPRGLWCGAKSNRAIPHARDLLNNAIQSENLDFFKRVLKIPGLINAHFLEFLSLNIYDLQELSGFKKSCLAESICEILRLEKIQACCEALFNGVFSEAKINFCVDSLVPVLILNPAHQSMAFFLALEIAAAQTNPKFFTEIIEPLIPSFYPGGHAGRPLQGPSLPQLAHFLIQPFDLIKEKDFQEKTVDLYFDLLRVGATSTWQEFVLEHLGGSDVFIEKLFQRRCLDILVRLQGPLPLKLPAVSHILEEIFKRALKEPYIKDTPEELPVEQIMGSFVGHHCGSFLFAFLDSSRLGGELKTHIAAVLSAKDLVHLVMKDFDYRESFGPQWPVVFKDFTQEKKAQFFQLFFKALSEDFPYGGAGSTPCYTLINVLLNACLPEEIFYLKAQDEINQKEGGVVLGVGRQIKNFFVRGLNTRSKMIDPGPCASA